MQESKSDFFTFCEMVLKEIYKDRVDISDISNNKQKGILQIIVEKDTYVIETEFELKILLRGLISSNNINDIIRAIIKIKYRYTDKKNTRFLNALYPNIDVFIASYLRLSNNNHLALEKINNMIFEYDDLFQFLVKTYIEDITTKKNKYKKDYDDMIDSKIKIEDKIDYLENRLRVFQVIKKNKFYYETYQNFLSYEEEIFNDDKVIIEEDIHSLECELALLNKKLKKIKKQEDNFVKINKMTNGILNSKKEKQILLSEISIKEILSLEKEKNYLLKELGKMISHNKNNIKRNLVAFEKFLVPYNITVEQYLEYYNESLLVDCKELLNELNLYKNELGEIEKKINKNEYLCNYRILKYFCLDNLKIIDTNIEMDSIILDNIIDILTINSK